MRILVVEDSASLRSSLRRGLTRLGHAVDSAADGEEALGFLAVNEYDVLVLDLMLPGVDGWSVLRRLRSCDARTPVLILSARDQVQDRVRGLDLGADDYLVKPFSFDELCARISALGRRKYDAKNPLLRVGGIEIDTAARRVERDGEPVHLTPKEYALLEALVLERGRVLSRARIMERIYDGETYASENVVDVLVCNLRRKLGGAGEAPLIVTRRGHGYLVPE